MQEEVLTLASDFDVIEIPYDEWRATQLAQQLAAQGANPIQYPHTVKALSPPMKELEAAIKAKRFHHDGNPVFKWMASNVVAKADNNNNLFPNKEKPEMKIDGIVALLMGIGRAIVLNEDTTVNKAYENHGIRFL
ncbi:terminase large subunit [Spartinivicinus sp. A2-2]|uniref:Terminase large subunit n=1 Tax=Spartinivicinus poritis TaxID=2994640 RepID=A0ABT5UGW9_9GAMM|nr:terminase TerL endonuclease subunit [Spartinivicinus sp. A2-2]MDE1465641.1 terminase large subunit [Spartinivicinus sp. A2-2]